MLGIIAFPALWWSLQGGSSAVPPVTPSSPADPTWVPPYGDDTVKDSSGHQNHGIVMGATIRGVPGHQGTAYSFDRKGSWAEVPSAPSLNPGARNFMVSAWINFAHPPQPGDTFDVARKGLSFTRTGMYKLELVSGGRARCTAKDHARAKARITSPQTGLADGRWHHIGCARVGPTWSVTVDGVATTKRAPLGEVDNDLPLAIGSKYGTEDLPHGGVDDVALYVGAPVSAPVASAAVRQRIRRMAESRPYGHWLLDERP